MKNGNNINGCINVSYNLVEHLIAIDDNGFVSNYWYDAAGERTVKESGYNEGVYVNGGFSGGVTNDGNASKIFFSLLLTYYFGFPGKSVTFAPRKNGEIAQLVRAHDS